MPFGCDVVMLMSLDILFKKGARKITCDNLSIGVKFGRMPMKDLLILVRTPENLKVFGQLSPEFDTDKRKGKNNNLRRKQSWLVLQ